ncbi:ABC transporter ATP-binding protein [Paenibacillus methanolicus]|uniref:ABC transporter ATP-binding protein n=1 Tax=Paenibacillus methanolicus TaxID=582686 RepID=UPI0011E6A5F2|nr:ABC transporter ATP-binding protein [Paenibacillus methanolicus]
MSFVRIGNVRKAYQQQPVLNRVHIEIGEGELVTLLGPSGCGKSTLLRAIAGLTSIDEGSIEIGGRDVTALPPKARQVGMVFQSYALFPNMTVFENIAFGLKMDGMKRADYTPLVEEMIGIIALEGMEDRYPAQLSGGQQQRVALGRALVKRPKVLLLDEPLSALDAQIRRSLRGEIRAIQRKLRMTTVFVTHDQEEALTISDRIIVMNRGGIEQEGAPEDIYAAPATEFVSRFIGSYNVWERTRLSDAGLAGWPPGELFAVRPEAIVIRPASEEPAGAESSCIVVSGRVGSISILGSIKRFEVDAGALGTVTVDALHDAHSRRLQEAADVKLYIPREACSPLRKSS